MSHIDLLKHFIIQFKKKLIKYNRRKPIKKLLKIYL